MYAQSVGSVLNPHFEERQPEGYRSILLPEKDSTVE